MPVFFDPHEYLEADPADAGSEREAARLVREAEQRAKLCDVTTRLAGELGYEGAKIYVAAREAKLGLGTYYKLYGSVEACLVEAFEKCSAVLLRRVEEVLADEAEPEDMADVALRRAIETLQADANVARLLLGGIRAGGDPGREAQQKRLDELAALLANRCGGGGAAKDGWMAQAIVGALGALLAIRVGPGESGDLERALPELIYVVLMPYLGVRRAVAARRRAEEELIGRGGTR